MRRTLPLLILAAALGLSVAMAGAETAPAAGPAVTTPTAMLRAALPPEADAPRLIDGADLAEGRVPPDGWVPVCGLPGPPQVLVTANPALPGFDWPALVAVVGETDTPPGIALVPTPARLLLLDGLAAAGLAVTVVEVPDDAAATDLARDTGGLALVGIDGLGPALRPVLDLSPHPVPDAQLAGMTGLAPPPWDFAGLWVPRDAAAAQATAQSACIAAAAGGLIMAPEMLSDQVGRYARWRAGDSTGR